MLENAKRSMRVCDIYRLHAIFRAPALASGDLPSEDTCFPELPSGVSDILHLNSFTRLASNHH